MNQRKRHCIRRTSAVRPAIQAAVWRVLADQRLIRLPIADGQRQKLRATGKGPVPTYSVEKLPFGADAIIQLYGKAGENPSETRRTAD
jgi:hypothetical protein